MCSEKTLYNYIDAGFFVTRTVKFYDGEKAYTIDLSITNLKNGEKVAYAKRFYGYDAELIKKYRQLKVGVRKISIQTEVCI